MKNSVFVVYSSAEFLLAGDVYEKGVFYMGGVFFFLGTALLFGFAACSSRYDEPAPVAVEQPSGAGGQTDDENGQVSMPLATLSVTGTQTKTLYFAGEDFDGAGLTVTATYGDGSHKTVTTYTTDLGSAVCSAGKTVTISYTEDGVTKDAAAPGTYYIAAADALTPTPVLLQGYAGTLSGGTYYQFGDFPQTVSALTDEAAYSSEPVYNGWYLASDGYFYAKCAENAYGTGKAYKYSDGTQVAKSNANSTRWFKVEPIAWRVLNPSESGNKILLSERILTANIAWYDYYDVNRTIGGETVYPKNYEHSKIRAYLNGLSYEKKESDEEAQETDSTYSGKGFLQTAFTPSAQSLIAMTSVDNSAENTNPASNANLWNDGKNDYACGNTNDKIFCLSEKEATTSDYGFAEYNVYAGYNEYGVYTAGNARIRVTTDYAKANYAEQSGTSSYGGWWWLRSPKYDYSYYVYGVYDTGRPNYNLKISDYDGGVVPALSISVEN